MDTTKNTLADRVENWLRGFETALSAGDKDAVAALFQRESAELRALNAALQREIAERKRVQQTLAVAEQTLEQSSKLAALGEMSAAVSHELNQPLAAMKTYLAGAHAAAEILCPQGAADLYAGQYVRCAGLVVDNDGAAVAPASGADRAHPSR